MNESAEFSYSRAELSTRILHCKREPNRPNSYVAAVVDNEIRFLDAPQQRGALILCLPKELWLSILANYSLTAKDLVAVEKTCRWFSMCLQGYSITEEAARINIKWHRSHRFGQLTNRVMQSSWKEKLHMLELLEARTCKLATGSYQNVYVTNHMEVVTWGAGRFGQLGNGAQQDSIDLQHITQSIPADSGKVIQVSAGCGHTSLLTGRGKVFTCGDNRYFQLGQSNFQGKLCLVPTMVTGLSDRKIIQVACGSTHTLFLCDTGQVLVSGLGDSGQLGLGPRVKSSMEPRMLDLPYEDFNFILITAGIAHNILVTECGKAFSFGLGSAGQLGHGGTKNLSTPSQVTAMDVNKKKIVFAAASVCHSILVDAKGGVYTCGEGRGILGHEDTGIKTVPKRVEALRGKFIVFAAAGVGRSVFITRDGLGFWCGKGMADTKNQIFPTPVPMDLPEPVDAAAIGNSHIVLRMKSGRLMSMGSNGRYQTGLRTEGDSPIAEYTYIPNT